MTGIRRGGNADADEAEALMRSGAHERALERRAALVGRVMSLLGAVGHQRGVPRELAREARIVLGEMEREFTTQPSNSPGNRPGNHQTTETDQ
jgi:hypothetical protein